MKRNEFNLHNQSRKNEHKLTLETLEQRILLDAASVIYGPLPPPDIDALNDAAIVQALDANDLPAIDLSKISTLAQYSLSETSGVSSTGKAYAVTNGTIVVERSVLDELRPAFVRNGVKFYSNTDVLTQLGSLAQRLVFADSLDGAVDSNDSSTASPQSLAPSMTPNDSGGGNNVCDIALTIDRSNANNDFGTYMLGPALIERFGLAGGTDPLLESNYTVITAPELPNGYAATVSFTGTATPGVDYAVYTSYGNVIGASLLNSYEYSGGSTTFYIVPLNDSIPEGTETVVATLGTPYLPGSGGWDNPVTFNEGTMSVTTNIVDDDLWELKVDAVAVNDDVLLEPSYQLSGALAFDDLSAELKVVRIPNEQANLWMEQSSAYSLDDSYPITVRLGGQGTATANDDYEFRLTPTGSAIGTDVVIPIGGTERSFFVVLQEDDVYEDDETIDIVTASSWTGAPNTSGANTQDNVYTLSEEEVSLTAYQAPEFISGDDPESPALVNGDCYVKYIDPTASNTTLLGGKTIKAAIGSGRTCRYAFWGSSGGGSDEYSSQSPGTDPLLSINETTGVVTVLRQMTDEEIATTPSFTIVAYDATYRKLYDLATLTLTVVEISMIPFTPQTTYIDPMPIPEDMWKANQVGIRRNTDYDNGGSVVDSLISETCSAENDLIKVALNFDSSLSGVTYSIQRDSSNLKVWRNSDKQGDEYVFTNDKCVINASDYIWVEYASSGNESYTLSLIARAADTHEILNSEDITFRPFNSVTCAFVGENQIAGNDWSHPGVNDWVIHQLQNGYDVHVWDDGYDSGGEFIDCDVFGEGRAFDEVVNAVNNRGVTEVAVVGYSHGGGSVYNLTWRMYWDGRDPGLLYSPRPDSITKSYTLVFTSYIDAVSNSSSITPFAESRRPLGTRYHLNQYQTNGWTYASTFLSGTATTGGTSNNTNNISYETLVHSTIDEDVTVHLRLNSDFFNNVGR